VRLRHLPQIDTKHLEAATHTLLAVLDALRSRRFDVLHIHATGPALFSVLPRLVGTPTVVTIHGLDWRREKWGRLASVVLRLALRVAATVPDRTIVVSRELERHLREQFGTEPVYSPNGIDPADFEAAEPVEGLEPGRFLLFIGRLVPEKGVAALLRAFARTDLPHRLAIAGAGTHTGDYERELERLAAADDRVMMLGPVYGAQKTWLLKHATAVAQPSTLEGLPIVLLEAAANARPCVVSAIPEHLEVLGDRPAALATTFPPGDESALAQALTEVATDPSAPARGEALRDRVLGEYRWPAIADTTERVYAAVLRGRTRGRRLRALVRPVRQG
jgi:glycosyltransferase involved in cell wall biosynthesis